MYPTQYTNESQASKHVDLASIEAGLLPLARLVIADAHEMTYTVTAEGAIQVPRYNAVDRVAARSQRVLANDAKVSFFADVEKQNTPGKIGVKFRLQVRPSVRVFFLVRVRPSNQITRSHDD